MTHARTLILAAAIAFSSQADATSPMMSAKNNNVQAIRVAVHHNPNSVARADTSRESAAFQWLICQIDNSPLNGSAIWEAIKSLVIQKFNLSAGPSHLDD